MITEVYGDKFIVVRRPCLIEDEGNYHVLAICDNRQEIAQFCKNYIEGCDSYFCLEDLLWIGSHFSPWDGPIPEELLKWMPQNIKGQ